MRDISKYKVKCTKIRRMDNGWDNWAEKVKDAASGYGATVLGVVCFILSLAIVMALVRMIVGVGTSV